MRRIRSPGGALLPNMLVNDPSLDLDGHDTQIDTTSIPAGGGRIVAVYFDSGSFGASSDHYLGWSLSKDGGLSFSDQGALPDDPGGRGEGGGAILARDPISGTLFLACYTSSSPSTVLVFRSEDGGESFESPVTALEVTEDQDVDKPWIAVDSAPGPAPSYVYVVVRLFDDVTGGGIRIATSTDGGRTFTSGPGQLLPETWAYGVNLVVGADHALHLFWWEPGVLMTRTSVDHGLTFGPSHLVADLVNNSFYPGLGLEFYTDSFPQGVADPDDPQELAVAFADQGSGSDRADIFVVQSNDGGSTWSTPARVNTDSSANDQWAPTVATTPDGERLFVGWYDRRGDPRNWQLEYWGRVGEVAAGTITFDPDFPVSSAAFPPVFSQDDFVLVRYMGTYDQASSDNEFFYATWEDNRLDDAWNANQPDVRLVRIPRDGPGPLLAPAGASFVAGSCDVQDDAAEPGETVTYSFCLENLGSTATFDLGAELEPTGGVTNPGPPKSFGIVEPGGPSVCREFQFTVDPALPCAADLTPTFSLSDLGGGLGAVEFELNAADSGIATYGPYTNPTPITLGTGGPAIPYPSPLQVAGAPDEPDSIAVSLHGLTHSTPNQINLLLVGPQDASMLFMSSVGGFYDVYDLEVGFSDSAITRLDYWTPLTSGGFLPTDSVGACQAFLPPAPPDPPSCAPPEGLATFESTFSGTSPNGAWALFEREGLPLETGDLSGGWSLTITKRQFSCRCSGPFFVGDFEVGDASQWSRVVLPPGLR